jgi:hypothetical protein
MIMFTEIYNTVINLPSFRIHPFIEFMFNRCQSSTEHILFTKVYDSLYEIPLIESQIELQSRENYR